ncbi:Signal transduction histidine kinase [Oceanospirillum multiglobuliferum]|uniref:histidine kinase n=2 Tax=Oceanospirillum multiglobuliferum TaxID=64969 RepID=A0A1T4SB84_9GAMM|nr:hypothetical protein BTE48_11045 [Oceanospirillum multiglobuliferum]SKA25504.1 Signal transduction histidine kinase [Oceanospirillum multiglobuliferum]
MVESRHQRLRLKQQGQAKTCITLYWIVFCCLVLLMPKAAVAAPAVHDFEQEPLIPQFEFFVDKEHRHTLETIRQLPDNAFKKAPVTGYAGGYNRAVHWLRFTIPAATQPGQPLWLRIHPAYTDFLTLYRPDTSSDDTFVSVPSGEMVENWEKKTDRAFVFQLHAQNQAQRFYLRLSSSNNHSVIARVYSQSGYIGRVWVDYTLSGLYIGLLIALFILNIRHHKVHKNKLNTPYLALVAASLFTFISGDNWIMLLLPDSSKAWASYLPQVGTLIYTLTLSFFYHRLFEFQRQRNPIGYYLSIGFMGLTAIGFLALLLDLYIEYMPLLMKLSALYLLWTTGVAFSWWYHKRRHAGLILIAALLIFFGTFGTALFYGGWVASGILVFYSYTIGTLSGTLVFHGLISRQLRQLEQQYVTALLEKEHTEQLLAREQSDKEQKAQFISMLSHELKTPLSVISMGSAQSNLSEKARHYVQQAINDMSRVIDRCAVLEQVDHQVETRQETVELIALLDTLIQQSPSPTRIQRLFSKTSCQVQSDSDWLRVILSNLLDNALKYSPPETTIRIGLSCHNQQICVVFHNWTADPLPDGEKIFTKYYRAKSAHKKTGSGLGLYIVKRLADQLGGSIRYQSAPANTPLLFESDQITQASGVKEKEMLQHNKMNQVEMSLCLPDLS